MSGSKSQANEAAPGGGADPSMEDILASIRRILSEEDLPAGSPDPSPTGQSHGTAEEDEPRPAAAHQAPEVFILDESMLVADPSADDAPSDEEADEPEVIPPQPVAELEPEADAEPEQVPVSTKPELETVHLAPPEDPPFQIPPTNYEPEPERDPESLPIEPVKAEQEPPPPSRPVLVMPSREDPFQPEPVKTEPPMPSAAVPALTSSEAERLTAAPGIFSPRPTGQTTAPSRMPAFPVLVAVPLPGQNASPSLMQRPAPVITRVPDATPEPPASASPAEIEPSPEPPPAAHVDLPSQPEEPAEIAAMLQPAEIEQPPAQTQMRPQSESPPMSASLSANAGLASAETATAAAGSVTNLVRALSSDRGAQVHSGGPTIADLVREEIRPMLKEWLDSNLPPLVERLVRAEIERVISRASV
jgi:cell pole-organizing protein PopZ